MRSLRGLLSTRRVGVLFVAAAAVFACSCPASADLITTRAELDVILGMHVILEDFESFDVPAGTGLPLDVTVLNDTTIANGQGPGLVGPGADYIDPSGRFLLWSGDGFQGLPTKMLASGSRTGELEISYTSEVQAMGLDLGGWEFIPFNGYVEVYDLQSQLLGTTPFSIFPGGADRVFFGWQNEEGISRVRIVTTSFPSSPAIDNHKYGVPEPATLSLLVIGAAFLPKLRRRRRHA